MKTTALLLSITIIGGCLVYSIISNINKPKEYCKVFVTSYSKKGGTGFGYIWVEDAKTEPMKNMPMNNEYHCGTFTHGANSIMLGIRTSSLQHITGANQLFFNCPTNKNSPETNSEQYLRENAKYTKSAQDNTATGIYKSPVQGFKSGVCNDDYTGQSSTYIINKPRVVGCIGECDDYYKNPMKYDTMKMQNVHIGYYQGQRP